MGTVCDGNMQTPGIMPRYRRIIARFYYIYLLCCALVVADSCSAFSPAIIFGTSNVATRRDNKSTTTQFFLSSEDDNDDFMASLRNRVEQMNDRETKLPLVILDSMLPRQTLKISVKNPLLLKLVGERLKEERPFFGMLGMARLVTGEQVHLKTGVEVEIVGSEVVADDETRLELKGGRRFVIESGVDNAPQGWTEARVRFLRSEEEEEEEKTTQKGVDDDDGDGRMSVARAITKAGELTSPTKNNKSLVERWIELARENERQPGQISALLEDIGPIPPSGEPTERALWIGALINPIPAMGVALEIRPALLTAKTAESRVRIAVDGILKSIKHMDKSAPLW